MTKGLGNCAQVICQLHIYTRAHRLLSTCPPLATSPVCLSCRCTHTHTETHTHTLTCTCIQLLLLQRDMLAIYWGGILVIGNASNHNAKHNFSCCVEQTTGKKKHGTSCKLNILIKNNCNSPCNRLLACRLKCS